MSKEKLPKAKYQADVDINGFMLSAAVLEDGTRVFSERSLANAFGIKGGGAYWKRKKEAGTESAVLPEYLSANYLKKFIPNELIEKFESAVLYESKAGGNARGVEATVLADICDVFVQAKNAGTKNPNLLAVADSAYKLIKGFAKVGIIALIDEATGYQYEREQKELEIIFKKLVSDEILESQKPFQISFYKEIFKLWGIPFTDKYIKRKPQFIGHITNRYVYQNLPKGTIILGALKQRSKKQSDGSYKYRFHRSLTEKEGIEALKKVLYSIEALASVARNKREFERLVNERYGQKELPFPDIDSLDKPEPTNPSNLSDFDGKLKKALDFKPKKGKGDNDKKAE